MELAASRASGLPMVVWLAPGTQAVDSRQEDFLAYLRSDVAGREGIEFPESNQDEMERLVADMLARLPAARAAPTDSHHPGRVYIVCGKEDLGGAMLVSDLLFERGLEAMLPATEGSELELIEDHKQSLLFCDSVLIYWGAANEAWLRTKLRDLEKVLGYGRARPFAAAGVWIGQPLSPAKDRFRTHEVMLVRDGLATEFVRRAGARR
jgi:hypothetical protein